MALTLDDLIPKPRKIVIEGVELTALPPRLSHSLALNSIGNKLQSVDKLSKADGDQLQKDLDEVLVELIPELKGKPVGLDIQLKIIEELVATAEPEDSKVLRENNVEFNNDPKVEGTG